jgi:secernin
VFQYRRAVVVLTVRVDLYRSGTMGGDMVVALGRATADGHTLFGHNSPLVEPATSVPWTIQRTSGRNYALGEQVALRHVSVPQGRQTYTTIGVQSGGAWGYHHGVNEHGVAVGRTPVHTRMQGEPSQTGAGAPGTSGPGIVGVELVRLALERSRTARQALDVLSDLIKRHGTGGGPAPDAEDSALLVADGREAFVVETAGRYWVYQEVREVRAVSDACTVRQDWDGIAPGLSSLAIEHGWWPGDGSKLDFAGTVAQTVGRIANPSHSCESALRRWGRATLLLEQQNGHIDVDCIIRVLSDHYDGCHDEVDPLDRTEADPVPAGPRPLCPHGPVGMPVSSLIVDLDGDAGRMPIAWCCPGPPCIGVYLPVLLEGELPAAFGSAGLENVHAAMTLLLGHIDGDRSLYELARDAAGRLQTRLDQQTEEFVAEATQESSQTSAADKQRRASLFMQHVAEQFAEMIRNQLSQRPARTVMVGKPKSAGALVTPFRV